LAKRHNPYRRLAFVELNVMFLKTALEVSSVRTLPGKHAAAKLA
jgi:hypothetical protein